MMKKVLTCSFMLALWLVATAATYDHNGADYMQRLTVPVAIHYGLRVDDTIDERLDPIIAKKAAERYIQDLKKKFSRDEIASMAYLNGAIKTINTAKRLKIALDTITEEDIEILKKYLPFKSFEEIEKEMIGALSKIQEREEFETIEIDSIARISIICDTLGINTDTFKRYNPMVKDVDTWIKDIKIYIPKGIVNAENIISILYNSEAEAEREDAKKKEKAEAKAKEERDLKIKKANAVKIYRVKSGDTLGHIAIKYHVTVRQIKAWNNLRSDFLRVGQRLKIKTL